MLDGRNRQEMAKDCFYWKKSVLRPICKQGPGRPPLSDSFFEEIDGFVTEEENNLNQPLLESYLNYLKRNSPPLPQETDNLSSDCFRAYDFLVQEKKKHANQCLELTTILRRHNNNMKIAYLNVNCVAGLKIFEVKLLILEGAFDVLY